MGSYLQPEPLTYINIKLTDAGRRKLSLGQLTFNSVVFSDKETNNIMNRVKSSLASGAIKVKRK